MSKYYLGSVGKFKTIKELKRVANSIKRDNKKKNSVVYLMYGGKAKAKSCHIFLKRSGNKFDLYALKKKGKKK